MVGIEQSEPFHPLVLLSSCLSPQQSASLAGAVGKQDSLEYVKCSSQGKKAGAGKIRSVPRREQKSPVSLGFWSLQLVLKLLEDGPGVF